MRLKRFNEHSIPNLFAGGERRDVTDVAEAQFMAKHYKKVVTGNYGDGTEHISKSKFMWMGRIAEIVKDQGGEIVFTIEHWDHPDEDRTGGFGQPYKGYLEVHLINDEISKIYSLPYDKPVRHRTEHNESKKVDGARKNRWYWDKSLIYN